MMLKIVVYRGRKILPKLDKVFFLIIILGVIGGCSFFFSAPSRYQTAKDKYYSITFHHESWKKQNDKQSDYSFIFVPSDSHLMEKAGQTLMSKSYCHEYQDQPLENLALKITSHFKNFTIYHQQTFYFNEREAFHLNGSGTLDGIKVKINLVNTRRNDCYYDFLFIQPNEINERDEIEIAIPHIFNLFLSSVKFQ